MTQFENPPERVYNPDMSQKKKRISDEVMMLGVGFSVILAVAILGLPGLEEGLNRVIGIIFIVAFAILFVRMPESDDPAWKRHLYLGAMTALAAALMALQPSWGVFPMLFFVLSPIAMMFFPQRIGLRWLLIFTVVTVVIFFTVFTPLEALMTTLPYAAGFWFFGAFARALASAEEARQESQRLLDELQTAHRQLQDYAARVEELAVAEERNRLAREMHDTLGHRLTVAAVQLEGAQRLIPRDPERATDIVSTVREQVREALGELRSAVATLREPLETDLPITLALQRLVTSFDEATDLTVHLRIPNIPLHLPNVQRLALYRAAQEALTNVQRHAQAQQVWMQLEIQDNCVALTVRDDGVGFPAETKEAAFGLRGMRERAAHLGGELHLAPNEAGGAQVEFILPLTEETEDDGNDSAAAGR
jgi:signal transduction histidine kinase